MHYFAASDNVFIFGARTDIIILRLKNLHYCSGFFPAEENLCMQARGSVLFNSTGDCKNLWRYSPSPSEQVKENIPQ